jgi:hypothetical protein
MLVLGNLRNARINNDCDQPWRVSSRFGGGERNASGDVGVPGGLFAASQPARNHRKRKILGKLHDE